MNSRSLATLTAVSLCLHGCSPRATDGGGGGQSAPPVLGAASAQAPREDHPYAEVLRQYIRGCNTGDEALLMSTFTDDVVVYFIDQPPVKGKATVARFWSDYHKAMQPRWTIDHMLVEGDEAVFEWSVKGSVGGKEQFSRGVDWYVFRDGRIAEIRQYYDVRDSAPPGKPYEQRGFPYKERGYPLPDDFDSHVR